MATADLIFLFGQRVRRCTHDVDKHFPDYSTLQYMDSGAVELAIDGRLTTMSGRWVWSCFPGPRIQFHAAGRQGHWSHRYLAFKGSRVDRWRADGLFPLAPRPAPASGMDFSAAFDALLDHAMRGDRRSTLRATHQLEGLLLELTEPAPPAAPTGDWLDRASRAIAASLGQDAIDYDTLAESLGTSPSTFRRRFVERFGLSPHAYLLHCRIGRARQLLGTTDQPLKSIAEELGYRDVFFFSRQFRAMTGVPPAAYRKSRLG